MDSSREKAIISLLASARVKSDAFIALAITPDGFFWNCDDRISIPDLHGKLQDYADAICQAVADQRAVRAGREVAR